MRALRRGRQFGAPVPMRLPVAVASVHRMPPASGPGTNHHKWYRPENDCPNDTPQYKQQLYHLADAMG